MLASLECIDFLLHDSDHDPAHEAREYQVALPRLSEGGLVVSDNAHASDALWRFARNGALRACAGREAKCRPTTLVGTACPPSHWPPAGPGSSRSRSRKATISSAIHSMPARRKWMPSR